MIRVVPVWKGHRSTDKGYPQDNDCSSPEFIDGKFGTSIRSSHPGAVVPVPRVGLFAHSAARELGSERRETVRSPIRHEAWKCSRKDLLTVEDRVDLPLVYQLSCQNITGNGRINAESI